MRFQRKKKMFKRRGENGEEIIVYAWRCDACRIWFGDEHPDDVWTCPYCQEKQKQQKQKKTWPMARKVR